MIYKIPDEYCFPIHHVRPRFKNDMENVLLYMARCCASLKNLPMEEYKERLFSMIQLFPENAGKKDKTIDNWRTEISALFGFYIEDKKTKQTSTGEVAYFLDKEQDLVQFFKYYLYKFQYPGGHLKSDKVKQFIDVGVKFKPVHYILKMLIPNPTQQGKPIGISKEETTYCIFNDLRVTRDNRDVSETLNLILSNRKSKIAYKREGDITRYAGDILDYMVQANLMERKHGYYYLNLSELPSIMVFVKDAKYFTGYDSLYGKNPATSALTELEPYWFDYVNEGLSPELFKTDLSSYFKEDEPSNESQYASSVNQRISEMLEGDFTTKDIGDLGENLVIGHEKQRLFNLGREDLIHLIKKIPTSLAVGYDIQSVEENILKRYIEVKTTISNNRINQYSFHLTENEWNTATDQTDKYYVYRLMLSRSERTIYILHNPVELYKQDKISMRLNDGAEIGFPESVAEKTELLIWKN